MGGGVSFQVGKVLIIVGIVMASLGLLLIAGSKFSFFGLGRLPGDITYKGRNVTFYFPIVTGIVLSVILTLILWLISLFSRR